MRQAIRLSVLQLFYFSAAHQALGQTTTDGNGRYSFAGLNGTYNIAPRATDAAFLPPLQTVTVTPTNARSADFVGYAAPYLIGRVTDAAGSGVAGVTVQRVGHDGRAASTLTDAAGYYGFGPVATDYYNLTPSKPGYAFLPFSQTAILNGSDKGGTVNFSALQGAYLSGRVTQRNGSGVARIGVVLKDETGNTRVTLTDAGGYYGFSDVEAGSYDLLARGPNYSFLPPMHSFTTDGKNSVIHLDFSALATPFISGRITTPAGDGVQSVIVTLRQQSSSNSSTVTAVVNTNSQGYYGFASVASGTYVITPSLSGYTFRPPLQSVTINTTEANPRISYSDINFIALSATTSQTSPVTLSTTQVNASANTVQLRFSGALDAASASAPTHFTITIDGRPIAAQSATYNAATHTVTLAVAAHSLVANSPVKVTWSGLLDANQLPVANSR